MNETLSFVLLMTSYCHRYHRTCVRPACTPRRSNEAPAFLTRGYVDQAAAEAHSLFFVNKDSQSYARWTLIHLLASKIQVAATFRMKTMLNSQQAQYIVGFCNKSLPFYCCLLCLQHSGIWWASFWESWVSSIIISKTHLHFDWIEIDLRENPTATSLIWCVVDSSSGLRYIHNANRAAGWSLNDFKKKFFKTSIRSRRRKRISWPT